MAVEILLAAASERTRQRIAQMLAEADGLTIAHVAADGSAVEDTLDRNAMIDIVIIDEALDDGRGHAVARSVAASNPLVGVVLLVEAAGPEQFAAAMDVGARSVISESSSLSEMVSRLESVAQWATAARSAVSSELSGGRGGRVIAVAGAKGGVGATAVALLVAQSLTATRTVCLIDFDLQSGDLAAYAGVHTRRSIVDLVDIAGEMSGRVLRETSYDISGGLRLLPAPNDGERAEEMTAEAARAVVNALRYQFDVAVVDVGSRLDDATALVLEYADSVLLVATPDLPALRAARRTLAMWERLSVRTPAAVDVVLNRRSSRSEVQESLAHRIIDTPVALVVPDGGAPFESAMNTATILTASTPAHTAAARYAAIFDQRGQAASGTGTPTAPGGPDQPDASEPESGRRRGARTRRTRKVGGRDKAAGRDKADGREKARTGDAGQVLAELPVVFTLGLLLFFVCAQCLAWGAGFVLARNAAQEGARTVSMAQAFDPSAADRARADALDELSGPWRTRATVDVQPGSVQVSIVTPTLVPGLRLVSDASAAVFEELR